MGNKENHVKDKPEKGLQDTDIGKQESSSNDSEKGDEFREDNKENFSDFEEEALATSPTIPASDEELEEEEEEEERKREEEEEEEEEEEDDDDDDD